MDKVGANGHAGPAGISLDRGVQQPLQQQRYARIPGASKLAVILGHRKNIAWPEGLSHLRLGGKPFPYCQRNLAIHHSHR